MNISVLGLGYVGCVSLGCLAKNGHNVIGVDVNEFKVGLINKGTPTIVEKDIDKIIAEGFEKKRIRATTDYYEAVIKSDISLICVGTPSSANGHLNLGYIYKCAKQIGTALKQKNSHHIVVIRSTVLPGTNKKVGEIIEEQSNKKLNTDFSVVSNPEFMREGSAVSDYFNPPLTVIGSENADALAVTEKMYENTNGPIERVDISIAEIIKYINNSFHALKIVFANEVGNICKQLNIDSHEVMRIFGKDEKLNISNAYFKPGFAYGGSCLPKDLKALTTLAHDFYLETPVLNAIESSNDYHKKNALNIILNTGKDRIGFMGISFKTGTDDLRYSPAVDLVEKLIGKGKDVKIFDDNVNISKLVGVNKSYIEEKLPHISSIMEENFRKLNEFADVIVIPNTLDDSVLAQIDKNKIIIDFVKMASLQNYPNYIGLSW
ncbi:UDP-glucose dehydrogenase family protein [Desulfotignum balticum]|uniref:UDP-glucose dehydrogenase family protein n=1 Tax=Desulfotignum balticum TaxID=115781 RepID=UPI0004625CD4|nr:nucleotide sugar dehydrogenase [Desulfotignum balticum]